VRFCRHHLPAARSLSLGKHGVRRAKPTYHGHGDQSDGARMCQLKHDANRREAERDGSEREQGPDRGRRRLLLVRPGGEAAVYQVAKLSNSPSAKLIIAGTVFTLGVFAGAAIAAWIVPPS